MEFIVGPRISKPPTCNVPPTIHRDPGPVTVTIPLPPGLGAEAGCAGLLLVNGLLPRTAPIGPYPLCWSCGFPSVSTVAPATVPVPPPPVALLIVIVPVPWRPKIAVCQTVVLPGPPLASGGSPGGTGGLTTSGSDPADPEIKNESIPSTTTLPTVPAESPTSKASWISTRPPALISSVPLPWLPIIAS